MELARSTSRGGFSVRSVFVFALTVLATALLWTVLASAPTHAAQANWNGQSILYDGHQYYSAGETDGTESHGLAKGTNYYLHVETISDRPLVRKAHVIYFAPGNSPPTATSAEYVVYDYSPDQQFSNPQNRATIEVVPQGEQGAYSSCAVQGGLGWVICPLTVTLAGAMDWIFEQIAQFVAVPPTPVNDTNSDLYVVWNVMRTIANVAFIIAFLIIIYSQITNLGVSNYGLKKLLPRLIVAALLVNLSFIITAIAVDLSNVIGYSLQDILIQLRQDTFNIDNETYSDNATAAGITATTSDWGSITGIILSGGAAVGGYAALAAATGGSLTSLVYLIVPLLLGLLLTLLFVLLVLAARQAIIIILIVVAPLAFVAYLLPNTEKWFEKWRDLFMTMLIFFPAFALVFGGSQLAGGIIIQNAYGAGSFVMVIFGMAVQVAPLIITPLLLQLSGSLLGRIAGMVNNPRKGLMDRTRNWSKERADMERLNSLRKQGGIPFGLRKTARRMDNSNRRVKERTALYTAMNDNRYNRTRGHEELHELSHEADIEKQTIEKQLERNLNQKTLSNPQMLEKQLELKVLTDEAQRTAKSVETTVLEASIGKGSLAQYRSQNMPDLMSRGIEVTKDLAAENARAQSAETATQRLIAESFNVKLKADRSNQAEYLASQALLRVAGGIEGSAGITRARGNAMANLVKLEADVIDNSVKLLNAEATLEGTTLKIHTGNIVREVLEGRGEQYEKSIVAAALEAQAQDGQVSIIEKARGSRHFDQTDVSKVIARNITTMKAKGGFHLQAEPNLNIEHFLELHGGNEQAAQEAFNRAMNTSRIVSLGDTSANNISDLKVGWLEDMARLLTGPDSERVIRDAVADGKRDSLVAAFQNFNLALENEQVRATIGDRIPDVERIRNRLREVGGTTGSRPSANPPSSTIDTDDQNVSRADRNQQDLASGGDSDNNNE